jgi:SpoVK/Ycf46/Vps4 family AAA+-type ATPase
MTDKMNNAMQNIILQEMETLDGIMIATTNLTDNFDPAFERRFLYKILFKTPETEVKTKIWKSMVNELTEDDAECEGTADEGDDLKAWQRNCDIQKL